MKGTTRGQKKSLNEIRGSSYFQADDQPDTKQDSLRSTGICTVVGVISFILATTMMKTPTDIKILSTIYIHYYKTFTNFRNEKNEATRRAKIFVPIDCKAIGKKLGVDGDIIFGRLYYYLNEKYSFTKDDNIKVKFFALRVGEEVKCIHFRACKIFCVNW